jgi:hypothetical protein
MPSSDFYWSRNLIRGLGKMWFPLSLQEAASTGGGESLLGSVVEELHGGFLGLGSYPAPYHMTTPKLILEALEKKQSDLSLPAKLILETSLTVPQQTLTVSKKGSLQAGVGPFPSLPGVFDLNIDYSRMASVNISFGTSTRAKYIPTDFLARLYNSVKGDAAKIDKYLAIKIDDNYIVDQILVANEFSVTFESQEAFDAEFGAKIDYLNTLPAGGHAKFVLDQKKNKRVTVQVKNGPDYLLALKVVDWDDLG